MMGPTHKLFGALAGVTVAAATGQSWAMIAAAGFVSKATSSGHASPDMDQSKLWVKVRKALPSWCDQLLNHRTGLSHWWGNPVLAWFFGIPRLPADGQWLVTLLLVGWVSHLVGDLLFGELALFPWGGPTFGLGLDTNGFLESGKLKIRGRERKVLPVAPARVLIVLAIAYVLWLAADLPTHSIPATLERFHL